MQAVIACESSRLARWFLFTLIGLLPLSVLSPCHAATPPPNDDLANAQIITTNIFSLPGTEVGATQEDFEKKGSFPYYSLYDLDSSVWYSITPEVPGTLKVGTKTGNGAAILLFSGVTTPSTDTLLAKTNPGEDFLPPVHVTAGQTYLIFVGNEKVGAHPFTLNGSLTPDSGAAPPVTPTATLTVKKPMAIRSTNTKGKVTVELTTPAPTDLSIAYAIAGTAVNGADYAMLSGSVVMPTGASSVDIKIKPQPDTAGDVAGTLKVKIRLQAGDGYTVGTPTKAVVLLTE